ncbi:demethylmenaquinone methyltransferase [Paucilactobacillus kaifaensis]|uniref:demethylmenaquinone methyltransferase n=1 Tax=Paucilactobacillus kaifaensis TaxID=2559921 RepID=UPI0010F93EDC|nr:demethylmenaquinone methyltransferase [Paucilactobacillus kaifaensis]
MKKNKSTQVHTIFQKIAPSYDKMNTIISLGTHQSWRKQATALAKLRPNSNILDVCCGTGDWTVALAQQINHKGHVTGLDFSDSMLAVAKEKIAKYQLDEKASLLQGDAMQLPFDDNKFDIVTIGFGLRNVANALVTLQEMFRVLKPGGQLICLETSQPTAPVIRQGWELYFGHIVPLLGKTLVNEKKEYTYLTDSTHNFVNYKQLASMFWQVGLKHVYYHRIMFGAAAIHTGIKP